MTNLVISPESTYSDVEHDFIESEPPGLFPSDQTSVWGQVRKTYADYLQVVADLLSTWYENLDPATVSNSDIPEWEYMLNLPTGNTGLPDAQRRAAISSRFKRGPFTRARRAQVVESFITPTFGSATLFNSSGIPFDGSGISMFSGFTSLAGTYEIVENISGFSYTVYILSSITIDVIGLTRELARITPGAITFTISQVTTLP